LILNCNPDCIDHDSNLWSCCCNLEEGGYQMHWLVVNNVCVVCQVHAHVVMKSSTCSGCIGKTTQ